MNHKTLAITQLLALATTRQAQDYERHHMAAMKGHDMAAMKGHDMAAMEGHDMAAMEGHDMAAMEGHDMAAMKSGKMEGDMTQMGMTKGTITRIDEVNQKVGIKHEENTTLNMPAMTMVFNLADPAQLKDMKVGDAVSFQAEDQGSKLTLTHLQKQ